MRERAAEALAAAASTASGGSGGGSPASGGLALSVRRPSVSSSYTGTTAAHSAGTSSSLVAQLRTVVAERPTIIDALAAMDLQVRR